MIPQLMLCSRLTIDATINIVKNILHIYHFCQKLLNSLSFKLSTVIGIPTFPSLVFFSMVKLAQVQL
jgi:hypothetical protein